MITAIPLQENAVCESLSMADEILFIDRDDQEVARVPSPVIEWNCQSKQAVIALLLQMNVSRVQLAQVGAGLLQSLINAGIEVMQTWSQGEQLPPRFRLLSAADLSSQRAPEHSCCGRCQD